MTRTDSLFFSDAEAPSQRARMLDAITRAVAEKGYARVTVSDIVAHAGVSRRTFYEQFEDKEDCLLAAAAEGTGAVLTRMAESAQTVGADANWQEILAAGIGAYVNALAAHPDFTTTFLVDIPGTSPRAIQLAARPPRPLRPDVQVRGAARDGRGARHRRGARRLPARPRGRHGRVDPPARAHERPGADRRARAGDRAAREPRHSGRERASPVTR